MHRRSVISVKKNRDQWNEFLMVKKKCYFTADVFQSCGIHLMLKSSVVQLKKTIKIFVLCRLDYLFLTKILVINKILEALIILIYFNYLLYNKQRIDKKN